MAAVKAFTLAEQKVKEFNIKLAQANKNKKSVDAILEEAESQAENHRQQLCKIEDQLTTAKVQIEVLKKKLEKNRGGCG